MSPMSVSYVCIPCRLHRSMPAYYPSAVSCTSCNQAMYHIGSKIEIPPHADVKAWKMFYDQLTSPEYWAPNATGSCVELDAERHAENQHWRGCKIRLEAREKGKEWKCDRCEAVEQRMPKHGRDWNDVVR